MKARKKPVVVEVVLFYLSNPDSIDDVKAFTGKYFAKYQEHYASELQTITLSIHYFRK